MNRRITSQSATNTTMRLAAAMGRNAATPHNNTTGSAAHVGFAYNAARAITVIETTGGVVQAVENYLNGNGSVMDALAFVPAAGAVLGRLTDGLGIFRCFVGDTPVVVDIEQGAALAAADPSIRLVPLAGGTLCLALALGRQVRLRRRRDEEEEEELEVNPERKHHPGMQVDPNVNCDSQPTHKPREQPEPADLCDERDRLFSEFALTGTLEQSTPLSDSSPLSFEPLVPHQGSLPLNDANTRPRTTARRTFATIASLLLLLNNPNQQDAIQWGLDVLNQAHFDF